MLNLFTKFSFPLLCIFIEFTLLPTITSIDCVSVEPNNILDCSLASVSYDSCCFFIKQSGRKACIWWGSKFIGSQNKSDGLTDLSLR